MSCKVRGPVLPARGRRLARRPERETLPVTSWVVARSEVLAFDQWEVKVLAASTDIQAAV